MCSVVNIVGFKEAASFLFSPVGKPVVWFSCCQSNSIFVLLSFPLTSDVGPVVITMYSIVLWNVNVKVAENGNSRVPLSKSVSKILLGTLLNFAFHYCSLTISICPGVRTYGWLHVGRAVAAIVWCFAISLDIHFYLVVLQRKEFSFQLTGVRIDKTTAINPPTRNITEIQVSLGQKVLEGGKALRSVSHENERQSAHWILQAPIMFIWQRFDQQFLHLNGQNCASLNLWELSVFSLQTAFLSIIFL